MHKLAILTLSVAITVAITGRMGKDTIGGSKTPPSDNILTTEQADEPPLPEKTLTWQEVPKPSVDDPQALIAWYAHKNGADQNLAYWVAWCESRLKNVPNSQGEKYGIGIYQFIRSTWNSRCEGDIWNVDDNVACGTELLGRGELSHWRKYSGHCWLPKLSTEPPH